MTLHEDTVETTDRPAGAAQRANATQPQFNLCGKLPARSCVLEASAGTGKTYAIAALAVRFLAEGHTTVRDILMVTFGRMATAELRSRVYQRLQSTRDALRRSLGMLTTPDDAVDRLLCSGTAEQVAERLQRIDSALADIDQATITTTHEFCSRMLAELGLLVDHDENAIFVDDLTKLTDEVVRDLYIARYANAERRPGLDEALRLGQGAIAHSRAPIVPADPAGAAGFAIEVRRLVESRKRRRDLYTFDDMVTRLLDALSNPDTGLDAARLLSQRYPFVLVDEFQDTDPAQWEILRRGFTGSTTVLIGDPKQAIYAFRDADVAAYLDAVGHADDVFTLGTNYRSDQPVVSGVEAIFRNAGLGSGRDTIPMRHVAASRVDSRLAWGLNDSRRVIVRAFRSEQPLRVKQARARIDADLIATVQQLTGPEVRLAGNLEDFNRRVRPSDIAILVTTNSRGHDLHQALTSAGIAAVFAGAASIYTSNAAADWQTVLDALVDPRRDQIGRAALTSLFGLTSLELAAMDDARRGELALQVKRLGRLLDEVGVAAVFESLCVDNDVYASALSGPGGDRLLTDLRHVAESLNEAQTRQHLDGLALAEWLRQRRADAADGRKDDRTRRLESDRDAVQIMTVHRAKGLEFPIVLLPQAADEHHSKGDDAPQVLHWEGQRVLDVGGDANRAARDRQRMDEDQAESLRRFYVACTRASSALIMWWTPTLHNTTGSPLHRLLCNENPAGRAPDSGYQVGEVPDATHLNEQTVRVDLIDEVPRPQVDEAPVAVPLLEARRFSRRIDREWTRTSYSGLTAKLHDTAPTTADDFEPDEPALDDLPVPPPALPLSPQVDPLVTVLAPLPGGAQFGNVVHSVLEEVDFTSPRLQDDLVALCTRTLAHRPVSGVDPAVLAAGLGDVVGTSLGDLTGGRPLRLFGPADRLSELDFELPLARPGGHRNTVAELAEIWCDRSLMGDDDLLAGYGRQLAKTPAASTVLAGFLTGSIDSVLRFPTDGGQQRFVLLDYKTNRLPVAPNEPLTVHHYHPDRMARAMMDAHYPLQALLYCVALHRYLAWRMAGYQPDLHLGGVGYLFVRGLAGPATPTLAAASGQATMPAGVFTWRPSSRLVLAASSVLAGEQP